MQEFDVTLKSLLQRSARVAMAELTGIDIGRWLSAELPAVQNPRVDLIGEGTDGRLVHIEIQSQHDPAMPLRMAEYGLRILRVFGRLPQQIVLYVGYDRPRMETELTGPCHRSQYRLVDIREMDGNLLLDSDSIGDNVIAILARLSDQRAAVKRIVSRIAELPPGERASALRSLVILAGLRRMASVVEQETRNMPIDDIDIMNNEVIGPVLKRGIQQGLEQGLEQGREQGLEQGREQGLEQGLKRGTEREARTLLERLIVKRFGDPPRWARQRLAECTTAELEDLCLRVLDASSLTELLNSETNT